MPLAWPDMRFPLELLVVNSVRLAAWRAQHTQQAREDFVGLVFQLQIAEQTDWSAVNVQQTILLVQ